MARVPVRSRERDFARQRAPRGAHAAPGRARPRRSAEHRSRFERSRRRRARRRQADASRSPGPRAPRPAPALAFWIAPPAFRATRPSRALRSLLAAKAILSKAGPSASAEVDAMRRLLGTLVRRRRPRRACSTPKAPPSAAATWAAWSTRSRARRCLSRLAAKDALGAVSVLNARRLVFQEALGRRREVDQQRADKAPARCDADRSALTARPKVAKGPALQPALVRAGRRALGSHRGRRGARLARRHHRDPARRRRRHARPGRSTWSIRSGRRLSGSLCACDSSEVQLAMTDAAGAPQNGIPTRLLSPRARRLQRPLCLPRSRCPSPPTPMAFRC